jgi:hypothetical protein
MSLLLGAALAILSIAVVVYPFLKSRGRRQPGASGQEAGASVTELESIYESIRTLELEHQLGKVEEAAYQEQLRAYRWQAAEALRQQIPERDHRLRDADWQLEQEILSARGALNTHNPEASGVQER